MALALNIYRTKVGIASVTPSEIYKAPVGYSGVVLCSNVSNIGSNTRTLTLTHNRAINNVGTISTTVSEIFKDFPLEANDSLSAIQGKLILEPGDSIKISASANNEIKYVFSILETLN